MNQKILNLKKSYEISNLAEKGLLIEKEINEISSLLTDSEVHLLNEIDLFKNNREKDLLTLFKNFFKYKFESLNQVFFSLNQGLENIRK